LSEQEACAYATKFLDIENVTCRQFSHVTSCTHLSHSG